MKRDSRDYSVNEITYTLTREEVIAAVCSRFDIVLPPPGQEARARWKAYDELDGGLSIRLRFESLADNRPPESEGR